MEISVVILNERNYFYFSLPDKWLATQWMITWLQNKNNRKLAKDFKKKFFLMLGKEINIMNDCFWKNDCNYSNEIGFCEGCIVYEPAYKCTYDVNDTCNNKDHISKEE